MRLVCLISLVAFALAAAGCGGGTRSASCTIYDTSSRFYLVLRAPGSAREAHLACSSFVRTARQAGESWSLTKGKENYSRDVRVCALRGRIGQMEIYDSRSEHFGRHFCKVLRSGSLA